jgi:hypothetical protein
VRLDCLLKMRQVSKKAPGARTLDDESLAWAQIEIPCLLSQEAAPAPAPVRGRRPSRGPLVLPCGSAGGTGFRGRFSLEGQNRRSTGDPRARFGAHGAPGPCGLGCYQREGKLPIHGTRASQVMSISPAVMPRGSPGWPGPSTDVRKGGRLAPRDQDVRPKGSTGERVRCRCTRSAHTVVRGPGMHEVCPCGGRGKEVACP